jgi:alkanesulfonate monooxygenase SsuD/methylene tetrahydromethanopterin reductase-like flavin-dependent oxidoreductase (luciferase family)
MTRSSLLPAGAATERLKLATGIRLVAQRSHCQQIASLDAERRALPLRHRVRLNAWSEMEDRRRSGTRRASFARGPGDEVAVTEDEGGFEGDLVHVSRSWSWPSPQQPHPPVIMGGAGGP